MENLQQMMIKAIGYWLNKTCTWGKEESTTTAHMETLKIGNWKPKTMKKVRINNKKKKKPLYVFNAPIKPGIKHNQSNEGHC